MNVAAMLENGKDVAAAKKYLSDMEEDNMGLSPSDQVAIEMTVREIQRHIEEIKR